LLVFVLFSCQENKSVSNSKKLSNAFQNAEIENDESALSEIPNRGEWQKPNLVIADKAE
jgi:hypothetical protein